MQSYCSVSLRCCILLTALIASPLLAQTESSANPAGQSTPSPSELRVFDPSLLDTSVDPCDNFYRFSCNGWFKKTPLPPDQTSYGRFTELYELNRLHLKQILETAAAASPESRSSNEQKIGDEYASCMDTEATNKSGITPLKPELDRIAALKSMKDLPDLLGYLHRTGVNTRYVPADRNVRPRAGPTVRIQSYSSVLPKGAHLSTCPGFRSRRLPVQTVRSRGRLTK